MHPNFDNACQNVVNHVSNAHTAFAGHSVACVDTTVKRLLGRKRSSTQSQCQVGDPMSPQCQVGDPMSPQGQVGGPMSPQGQPGDTQSGYRPDMRSPRDSMSRGERLALRKAPTAAPPWAVIARALAS